MLRRIFFAVILIFTGSICFSCNDSQCVNKIEKELVSPDGRSKAVIFDRGCGAAVGDITGISVYPAGKVLNDSDLANALFAGKIYQDLSKDKDGKAAEGKINFDVKWIDSENLLILYSESERLIKHDKVGNINISYELISDDHSH